MGFLGSLFGNEVSHIGNLFSGFGAKNAEQLVLGAADPLSAKMWGGVTGQNFTPMVGQLGGETNAQYAQSDAQGVNTGPARLMGGIANAIAGAEAGSYFGGGGGLVTAGAGALDDGFGMSGGVGPFSSSGPPSAAGAAPGLGSPLLAPTPQQKLATALMLPTKPAQGSALDNVAAIANQTPSMRMLNQQAPFSLGGTQ